MMGNDRILEEAKINDERNIKSSIKKKTLRKLKVNDRIRTNYDSINIDMYAKSQIIER
jgi:hypothetical protein